MVILVRYLRNVYYFVVVAAHESDARRRMISKSFHHQLKVSERQAVTGPPESMREHVVAASKAMRNGLWQQCNNFIINEKMNAKVIEWFPSVSCCVLVTY